MLKKILVVITLLITKAAFSLTNEEAIWLDLSINERISKDQKWSYTLESQVRFLNEKDDYQYQLNSFNGGLGYYVTPLLSFWGGYEWVSHNPLSDTDRENAAWEQMIWQVFENNIFTIRTRTRFEHISRMHQPQWKNLAREKVTLYFATIMNKRVTPIIYDEIFISLNKPAWEDNKTLEENRIFLGADITLTPKFFLEVGFLQQYLYHQTGTTLRNVAYIGLNFNNSAVPIPQYVK